MEGEMVKEKAQREKEVVAEYEKQEALWLVQKIRYKYGKRKLNYI